MLFVVGFLAGLAAFGVAALWPPVEVQVVQHVGRDFQVELRGWGRRWRGSGRPLARPEPTASAGAAGPSRRPRPSQAPALFRRLLAAAGQAGRLDGVRLSLAGGVGDACATALVSAGAAALLSGLAAAHGHRPELSWRPSFTAARLEVTVEATYRARPAAVALALLRGLRPVARGRR